MLQCEILTEQLKRIKLVSNVAAGSNFLGRLLSSQHSCRNSGDVPVPFFYPHTDDLALSIGHYSVLIQYQYIRKKLLHLRKIFHFFCTEHVVAGLDGFSSVKYCQIAAILLTGASLTLAEPLLLLHQSK